MVYEYDSYDRFDATDRIAYDLPFDDIAKCAIYYHADVNYEKQCLPVLRTLAKKIEATGVDLDIDVKDKEELVDRLSDASGGIAWKEVYNQALLDILADHSLSDSVYRDKYGALCFVDELDGERATHCGDGNNEFPWWVSKKDLEKSLGEPVG